MLSPAGLGLYHKACRVKHRPNLTLTLISLKLPFLIMTHIHPNYHEKYSKVITTLTFFFYRLIYHQPQMLYSLKPEHELQMKERANIFPVIVVS